MSTSKILVLPNILKTGTEVIKFHSYSTQLSMKLILLINVKMPTIVDILTFTSMIITTSESLKSRKVIFQHFFFFISSWNFILSWVEPEKSFITSEPVLCRSSAYTIRYHFYMGWPIWYFSAFASKANIVVKVSHGLHSASGEGSWTAIRQCTESYTARLCMPSCSLSYTGYVLFHRFRWTKFLSVKL